MEFRSFTNFLHNSLFKNGADVVRCVMLIKVAVNFLRDIVIFDFSNF